jgi:hypothetical protein
MLGCIICLKILFFIYLEFFRYSLLRVAFDIERTKVMPQRKPRFLWPRSNVLRPRLGLIRKMGPVFRKESRASDYVHGSGWGMRAGFRREIPGERKLERGADGHGEEVGIVEGEEFDFLGGGENLGGFIFLLFGLLDRVAHVAGVLAVEGFFRTGKD